MRLSNENLVVIEGTDTTGLTKDNIRAAFYLRLPFRLRVGTFRRFTVDSDAGVEVCIRNAVDIPNGTETSDAVVTLVTNGGIQTGFSDALVFLNHPIVKPDQLTIIQDCVSSGRNDFGGLPANLYRISKYLNDFLIAYFSVTNEIYGGRYLRKINDGSIFELMRWVVTLICPAGYEFSDADLSKLCDHKPSIIYSSGETLTGTLDDLPESLIAQLEASASSFDDGVFYELAFEAKSRFAAQEWVLALIFSVVALEAVHGAFLRTCLVGKLPPDETDQWIESFLRDAGLYNLCRITPYLFMSDGERPTREQLDACANGITMRNDFMHSSIRRGKYKIRNRSTEEIRRAYNAVVAVYGLYVAAFEKLPGSPDSIEQEVEQAEEK